MSIRVYQQAGVTLLEQVGDREISPHAGDGRLDVMTCTFIGAQGSFSNGHHAALKTWFLENFAPYSAHPDAANNPGLRGMLLLPGSVVGRPSWSGLARISATYVGMVNSPALPDAFIETVTGTQVTLASEGPASAWLGYDTTYVTSVDYNADRTPELSGLINRLFRVEGISQGNSANNKTVQAIQRTDVIARHGPYTVLRHTFVPVFIAAINPQIVISNNRTRNATVELSGSLFDPQTNPPKAKVVRMTDCRQGDSFLNRLGA